MHKKKHTFSMVARTLRPSKLDGGVMALALFVPLLMGQASEGHQAATVIEMAIAGAITATVGLIVKTVTVAIGAGMRAYRSHTQRTPDGRDDLTGVIVGAMGDAIDPEHAGQDPLVLPPPGEAPPPAAPAIDTTHVPEKQP